MDISINAREVSVKLTEGEDESCLIEVKRVLSRHLLGEQRSKNSYPPARKLFVRGALNERSQLDLVVMTLSESESPMSAKEISDHILRIPGYRTASQNHNATISARLCASKEYFQREAEGYTLSTVGQEYAEKIMELE